MNSNCLGEKENLIDILCNAVDTDSKNIINSTKGQGGKLLLFGTRNSVFLRMVKKKCDSFGIPCVFSHESFEPPYTAVLCDTEEGHNMAGRIPTELDVDKVNSPGMPRVAQAILFLLLNSTNLLGKDVTIVGRGHSVKGLAKALLSQNATVTVAHSKTARLFSATENKDIVIYATPQITQEISYNTRLAVIDLAGAVPHPDRLNCPYHDRVGKLTVSILINRFLSRHWEVC